ncbi:glyoxalase [Comamonas serinivorans]|uniref:Glyoxalase n=1 Tax=Comamonas serinivorans TaxID=1082851 RepID=A0A1Y0ESD8_9BURK|nr:glyoxalase [Comamonas serinivorans]ARU06577.1 glyoxalase [Comamonas serinivorans]
MSDLGITEIKAFLPSRDYALSQRFYQDLGFTRASEGGGVAYFHRGHASFLLGDFRPEGPLYLHLLVQDVEVWWQHVHGCAVARTYADQGVTLSAIEQQAWRMRDFVLTDPAGVVWRIGQNTD